MVERQLLDIEADVLLGDRIVEDQAQAGGKPVLGADVDLAGAN